MSKLTITSDPTRTQITWLCAGDSDYYNANTFQSNGNLYYLELVDDAGKRLFAAVLTVDEIIGCRELTVVAMRGDVTGWVAIFEQCLINFAQYHDCQSIRLNVLRGDNELAFSRKGWKRAFTVFRKPAGKLELTF